MMCLRSYIDFHSKVEMGGEFLKSCGVNSLDDVGYVHHHCLTPSTATAVTSKCCPFDKAFPVERHCSRRWALR